MAVPRRISSGWFKGAEAESHQRPQEKTRPRPALWRALSPVAAAVGVCACLAAGQVLSPSARAQESNQDQVKAALLFNVAKFVEWSEETNGPMVLCVEGDDAFEKVLRNTADSKGVNGQQVDVRKINAGERAPDCRMAFISSSERRQTRSILASFQGTGTVTVSDRPDFAREGGIISFSLEDNRVHFEINVEAAQLAHLKISAKLLSLAKIVGN